MNTHTARLILLATFVLVLILFAAEIVPRAASLAGRYAALQETSRAAMPVPHDLARLKASERALRSQLAALSAGAPELDPLATLSLAAEEAGLSLRSVVPQDRERHGRMTTLPLECEVAGSFHALGRFLARLERSAPLVRVRFVEARAEQTTEGLAATVRLRIITFQDSKKGAE